MSPANRTSASDPVRSTEARESLWQWWLILALGIVTLGLGWIGFSRYYAMHGQPATGWHNLYVALQLFSLESGPVPAPIPLELNIVRFLAPVIAAWVLVKTVVLVFGERIRSLQMHRIRNHVVVCGLGRRGFQLARDFKECGERVIAIEIDPDGSYASQAGSLGITVVAGDATDRDVLMDAGVARASHVIAVTGDDGTNASIAVRTYQLVRERSSRYMGAVRCSIQIADLRLAALLQEHRILSRGDDNFVASIFNTYRTSARQVFSEHPLDYERIAPNDTRDVHLIIIGFGSMGESLALQAATTGCFANGRKLRVTAIDRVAEVRRRDFVGEHPEVDRLLRLEFITGEVEDPGILARVGSWADEPDTLTTIAVCLDSDSRSLSCALGVLSRLTNLAAPLLVRMSDESGLATLLEDEHGDDAWSRVHAFGTLARACTRDALLHEDLDLLARALHEDYVARRLSEGRPSDDASMRPWEELDESLKNSSRASADHIPVKLRAIGCCIANEGAAGDRVASFEPAEVELLAKMEHARWCAERLLSGWLPGRQRVPAEKKTPYLVDWDELSDEVKQYDRDVVEGIPRFLGAVNLEVRRAESSDRAV